MMAQPETVAGPSTSSTHNHNHNNHNHNHNNNNLGLNPGQAGLADQELLEEEEDDGVPPPPAYGDYYGEINGDEKRGKDTPGNSAQVTDDGRVTIRINHFNRHLSQIFAPTVPPAGGSGSGLPDSIEEGRPLPPPYIPPSLGGDGSVRPPPPLNVVIQVVGSRGDVQPFVALGKVLKTVYGHRVRLATHLTFKDFVEQQGLEFFNIGGDPTRLMAFMVKNPSLRPHFRSVMSGDVGEQRRVVAEYIQGCWRSCYRAGDGTEEGGGGRSLEEEEEEEGGGRGGGGGGGERASESTQSSGAPPPLTDPFVADCIIANPPSFAHIHCAEKLGIPLHIMFTMPYSPTQAFPHPLANIQSTNTDPQLTNYMSYALIELLSWQALGDLINRFRVKCLALDPISVIWAPGMLQRLRIPYTYAWSPALIPKPKDWGSHISVAGFFFLNTASNYTPDRELQAFLDAGPPPIYIGFGSIVLDDPDKMTELIFAAVAKTGQRLLLSKGWGGMGGADLQLRAPPGVFMLGNVPHDWLFQHVSCVVHHGGAGTTAAGIAAGRPTVVVPFFGDQPFWGSMIARAGAGPDPIPHKQLTADKLAAAIEFCLTASCRDRAQELAAKITAEHGCDTAAQSFHQCLDPDRLRCTLAPSRTAVWRIKHSEVRLSAFAACVLANADLLNFDDLILFRPQEYQTDLGPWDPISGGFTAFTRAVSGMTVGVADIPSETWRAMQLPGQGRRKSESRSTTPSRRRPSGAAVEGSNASIASGRSRQSLALEEDTEDNSLAPPATTNLSRRPSAQSTRTLSRRPSAQSTRTQNNDIGEGSSRGRIDPKAGKQPDMLQPTGVHMTKGAGRFVKAVVQGPVDMSVNFAKGFHNMPRLWGDDTVRPQEKVTGFKTGVKAVGKEFGYGWYDGVTGLVTQPWRGAKKNGAGGLVKGIGKGVGGFITKPSAALFGILGHTMQGLSKEVQKLFITDVQSYIVASRAAQGHNEWLQASDAEKQDVIARWKLIRKDLKKKGINDDSKQPLSWDRVPREDGSSGSAAPVETPTYEARSVAAASTIHVDGNGYNGYNNNISINNNNNNTISSYASQASLRTNSTWQGRSWTSPPGPVPDDIYSRSIYSSHTDQPRPPPTITSTADDEVMELVSRLQAERQADDDDDLDLGNVADSSKKDDACCIPSSSKAPPYMPPANGDSYPRDEKTEQEKSEEQVVLEYIKKQSLLEAQHRDKGKGRATATATAEDDENDQDLQRALKLSLQEQ